MQSIPQKENCPPNFSMAGILAYEHLDPCLFYGDTRIKAEKSL